MGRRYPGIEGYRNAGRKIGGLFSAAAGGIGGAIAGGSEGIPPEDATQNSMMAQDASGASDMGSRYGMDTPRGNSGKYPVVNRPNTLIRMFDPARARQMEQQGFESQMAQAGNEFELERMDKEVQNKKQLHEYELMMQSAREVMKRQGFNDALIEQIIQETGQTAANKAEFNRRASQQDVNLARGEPEVLYGNTKANLMQPGVANRATEAQTNTRNISNKYLDESLQLENKIAENRNRELIQNTYQSGLRFPFEQEIIKNQAEQSPIFPLHAGTIYGNVPQTTSTGRPMNYLGVMPAAREVPASTFEFEGQKIGSAGTPARPPQLFRTDPFGNSGTPQQPSQSTGDGSFAVPMPDGSVRIYRKRNP